MNAGLRAGPQDLASQTLVADVFMRISAHFVADIWRGQADGSITRRPSAEDLAGLHFGGVRGLGVIARTQPPPAVVRGLVRAAAMIAA